MPVIIESVKIADKNFTTPNNCVSIFYGRKERNNKYKMKKKKVLFISSTGGHFNELQQLKPLFKKYDYHIITEKMNQQKML